MTPRRLGVARALIAGEMIDRDLVLDGDSIGGLVAPMPGARGIACPGFVDLQINGFAGVDFSACTEAALTRAAETLASTGVTAFLPTVITAAADDMLAAVGTIANVARQASSARPVVAGVHLEGPFLAPNRLGTHSAVHRRDPDLALMRRLLDAGPIRLVTLAPELPEATALIRFLSGQGVLVAAGHTDATAEEARRGFDAGVVLTTHHGNAMRPFRPRDPGILATALTRPDVTVTVIADNHHLAPETLQLFATASAGRVALITDAAPLAGHAASFGLLGGSIAVRRVGDTVRNAAGDLAGSLLTMDTAVRNLIASGVPVPSALAAGSSTPAAMLGLGGATLAPGSRADVTVLDDDLGVQKTLVAGRTAFER